MASREEDNKLGFNTNNINNDFDKNIVNAYKKSEEILNSTSPFSEKIPCLIDVWRQARLYSEQPHKNYVIHLMDWLKRHTLNIILTGDWKKYKDIYEDILISEVTHCELSFKRNNPNFSLRCKKLAEIIRDPWGNQVLHKLLNSSDVTITLEELEFFAIETGYIISMRLKMLCESHCEDLALNLATTCLKCYRIAEEQNYNINATEDQKRFILDTYIALLYKFKKTSTILSILKTLSLQEGLDLVKRFSNKRVNISKIWRYSKKITHLAAQVYITAAVMKPPEESLEILKQLLNIWLSLDVTVNNEESLTSAIRRIIQAADSAVHMYIFCELIYSKFNTTMKVFIIELFIRALTTDMNDLERQKNEDNTQKVEEITKRLAIGFLRLADVLDDHIKVSRECVLTAFSLQPTEPTMQRIIDLAKHSGYEVLDTGQTWKCKLHPPAKPTDEILWKCVECGEEMSQPEFPTSLNTDTALSDALVAEKLGLSSQLCDDLAVVIAGPRYQVFSWRLRWIDLHNLCVLYLNDPDRTKNLVKELKFVQIDYSMFSHIKKEPEDDELAGIERGYEMYLEDDDIGGSEDSVSQDSQSNGLGSDDAGESPLRLIFPATPKQSDPNVLKSLRMFRPTLKRSKDRQLVDNVPNKVFVGNNGASHLPEVHTISSSLCNATTSFEYFSSSSYQGNQNSATNIISNDITTSGQLYHHSTLSDSVKSSVNIPKICDVKDSNDKIAPHIILSHNLNRNSENLLNVSTKNSNAKIEFLNKLPHNPSQTPQILDSCMNRLIVSAANYGKNENQSLYQFETQVVPVDCSQSCLQIQNNQNQNNHPINLKHDDNVSFLDKNNMVSNESSKNLISSIDSSRTTDSIKLQENIDQINAISISSNASTFFNIPPVNYLKQKPTVKEVNLSPESVTPGLSVIFTNNSKETSYPKFPDSASITFTTDLTKEVIPSQCTKNINTVTVSQNATEFWCKDSTEDISKASNTSQEALETNNKKNTETIVPPANSNSSNIKSFYSNPCKYISGNSSPRKEILKMNTDNKREISISKHNLKEVRVLLKRIILPNENLTSSYSRKRMNQLQEQTKIKSYNSQKYLDSCCPEKQKSVIPVEDSKIYINKSIFKSSCVKSNLSPMVLLHRIEDIDKVINKNAEGRKVDAERESIFFPELSAEVKKNSNFQESGSKEPNLKKNWSEIIAEDFTKKQGTDMERKENIEDIENIDRISEEKKFDKDLYKKDVIPLLDKNKKSLAENQKPKTFGNSYENTSKGISAIKNTYVSEGIIKRKDEKKTNDLKGYNVQELKRNAKTLEVHTSKYEKLTSQLAVRRLFNPKFVQNLIQSDSLDGKSIGAQEDTEKDKMKKQKGKDQKNEDDKQKNYRHSNVFKHLRSKLADLIEVNSNKENLQNTSKVPEEHIEQIQTKSISGESQPTNNSIENYRQSSVLAVKGSRARSKSVCQYESTGKMKPIRSRSMCEANSSLYNKVIGENPQNLIDFHTKYGSCNNQLKGNSKYENGFKLHTPIKIQNCTLEREEKKLIFNSAKEKSIENCKPDKKTVNTMWKPEASFTSHVENKISNETESSIDNCKSDSFINTLGISEDAELKGEASTKGILPPVHGESQTRNIFKYGSGWEASQINNLRKKSKQENILNEFNQIKGTENQEKLNYSKCKKIKSKKITRKHNHINTKVEQTSLSNIGETKSMISQKKRKPDYGEDSNSKKKKNDNIARKSSKNINSVLSSVPGLNDLEMIRPRYTDPFIQVVQVGDRAVSSTSSSQNSQTSTPITPHIQRIGQPRVDKPESHANSTSNSTVSSLVTSTATKSTSSDSNTTIINILQNQVVRSANTNQIIRPVQIAPVLRPTGIITTLPIQRTRAPPVINILSQQIIRPATIVSCLPRTTPTTTTTETQANSMHRVISGNDEVVGQLVNPGRTTSAPTLKTVVGTTSTESNRIVQFICKSSDGKLIPVTSLTPNKIVKVAVTQAVSSTMLNNSALENSFTKLIQPTTKRNLEAVESSESLPKFQQAFGKTVYQSSLEAVQSMTTTVDNESSNVSTIAEAEKVTLNKTQTKSTTFQNVHQVQGSVIYSRQAVGQTINLIPPGRGQVFRIAASNPEQISLVKDSIIHNKVSALLAAALQGGQQQNSNVTEADSSSEDSLSQPPTTVKITQQRQTLLQNARIVKPVVHVSSNVIRNVNNSQSNLSSTTLEQLREFDMVYKQVKERSNTSGASEATSQSDGAESSSSQINVTYLNQSQKLSCAPVVVVSSYCTVQSAVSPALSVTSQGSSSPCVTPAPSSSLKGSSKSPKSKSIKATTTHTSKASPIPKPQQKPQEDEHTTQRIFDILAEYAEQLRNSPDLNNKPAPRRRSNPPTNPNQNSKRKKSSGSKKTNTQYTNNSTITSDAEIDDSRTAGSEDSSCGIVQISLQDEDHSSTTITSETADTSVSPKQLILTETNTSQTRNLIIADSNVGEALKMSNTAVLVPGNYIMPVSMVKGGQQIAVVSGGSKILATVPTRSGPNMLLFQSFLNQTRKPNISTVKYSTVQPVTSIPSQTIATVNAQSSVILPSTSQSLTSVTLGQSVAIKKTNDADRFEVNNLNADLLLAISNSRDSSTSTVLENITQPADSTSSISVRNNCVESMEENVPDGQKMYKYEKHQTAPVATSVISQRCSKEEISTDSSPAQTMVSVNINQADYEKAGSLVKSEDRVHSVLVAAGSNNGPMLSQNPPNYTKQSQTVNMSADSTKDDFLSGEEKVNESKQSNFSYQGKTKKSQTGVQRLDRELHQLSLQRKQAALERELRLQKSLSEECEDLGVDEPSTSELFPEADIYFDSNHSPSFDQSSQDVMKRTSQPHSNKEDTKPTINLFEDDDNSGSLRTDFLFDDPVNYQSTEMELEYDRSQGLTNGQRNSSNGGLSCEDTTLLQGCGSMTDVTIRSPISPGPYGDSHTLPINKCKYKYSNRKKGERIKHVESWPVEASSSEDTTGSTADLNKSSSQSPELYSTKHTHSPLVEEELTDANFKVMRVGRSEYIKEQEQCLETHTDEEDIECGVSGRGARRSVKKMCSCCNGSQDGNSGMRKRPASRPHTPALNKKSLVNKKR